MPDTQEPQPLTPAPAPETDSGHSPGYEPADDAPQPPETLPADDEDDGGDYFKALDRHDAQ